LVVTIIIIILPTGKKTISFPGTLAETDLCAFNDRILPS